MVAHPPLETVLFCMPFREADFSAFAVQQGCPLTARPWIQGTLLPLLIDRDDIGPCHTLSATQKTTLFDSGLIGQNHTGEPGKAKSRHGEQHPSQRVVERSHDVRMGDLPEKKAARDDGDPYGYAVLPGSSKGLLKTARATVDSVEKLARGEIQSASNEKVGIVQEHEGRPPVTLRENVALTKARSNDDE